MPEDLIVSVNNITLKSVTCQSVIVKGTDPFLKEVGVGAVVDSGASTPTHSLRSLWPIQARICSLATCGNGMAPHWAGIHLSSIQQLWSRKDDVGKPSDV